jgi:ElaB/YqjD/DUF883 family membrane-anchored ribosome-binding protein
MARLAGVYRELERLKAEIEALGHEPSIREPEAGTDKAAAAKRDHGIEQQIAELNGLVKDMLAEAETTMAAHPVATVAGALALGIVIGRLTAR